MEQVTDGFKAAMLSGAIDAGDKRSAQFTIEVNKILSGIVELTVYLRDSDLEEAVVNAGTYQLSLTETLTVSLDIPYEIILRP